MAKRHGLQPDRAPDMVGHVDLPTTGSITSALILARQSLAHGVSDGGTFDIKVVTSAMHHPIQNSTS